MTHRSRYCVVIPAFDAAQIRNVGFIILKQQLEIKIIVSVHEADA